MPGQYEKRVDQRRVVRREDDGRPVPQRIDSTQVELVGARHGQRPREDPEPGHDAETSGGVPMRRGNNGYATNAQTENSRQISPNSVSTV